MRRASNEQRRLQRSFKKSKLKSSVLLSKWFIPAPVTAGLALYWAQISGDRGSLFLVRGTKDNKYLVSKLFDVTEMSNLEDTLHTEDNNITVAFGSGIVGTVALSKTPINIKDAYQVHFYIF